MTLQKPPKLDKPTRAQRAMWEVIRADGCIITGAHYGVEIAHCHGGSLKDIGLHSGMGQRGVSHWLVLPLLANLHRGAPQGLDHDVRAWEARHGTQIEHLNRLSERIGVDLWGLYHS